MSYDEWKLQTPLTFEVFEEKGCEFCENEEEPALYIDNFGNYCCEKCKNEINAEDEEITFKDVN